jgi:hypothetical protein
MSLKILNKICFTICIVCIVVGIVLGLALIWGSHDNEVMWKGLGTVSVLFAGSLLTLAVNNAFSKKSSSNSSENED